MSLQELNEIEEKLMQKELEKQELAQKVRTF